MRAYSFHFQRKPETIHATNFTIGRNNMKHYKLDWEVWGRCVIRSCHNKSSPKYFCSKDLRCTHYAPIIAAKSSSVIFIRVEQVHNQYCIKCHTESHIVLSVCNTPGVCFPPCQFLFPCSNKTFRHV